ncbi:OmpL47-type beta-barrel domain-containing protein [Scatolibacter rhodanostii]|uniref:OmpL47-type beta-barrel domain-containing protein n=1 Tax=Scatolibacter rhodanostii TaxID=2014781 RepID=UPI0013564C4A|nr:immunoglobulin-like domain-containing protein [Scatolibacter rhodanostii]
MKTYQKPSKLIAALLSLVILLGTTLYLPETLVASAASDAINYLFDIGENNVIIDRGTNPGTLMVTYNGNYVADNIPTEENITIAGTVTASAQSSNHQIIIQGGVTAAITLQNLTLDLAQFEKAGAFTITGGSTVNLTLSGDNTLKSGNQCAGIQVSSGNTLNIIGDKEQTLIVTGGELAAGIGGGGSPDTANAGNISIFGGNITVKGGKQAAGIGGGGLFYSRGGDGGHIKIAGGIVHASGGTMASSGAGIGGGVAADGGIIEITGGTVHAVGGTGGAGIGGGSSDGWARYASGNGGVITIKGGIVTATGGNAAGIGGGGGTSEVAKNGNGGTISISGGMITATAGVGASIGMGRLNTQEGTSVTITGGSINVTSINPLPTDGSEAVSLNTLTVGNPGVGDSVTIADIKLDGTPSDYGLTDTTTVNGSKLYLWLPQNSSPTASVSLNAGGKFYTNTWARIGATETQTLLRNEDIQSPLISRNPISASYVYKAGAEPLVVAAAFLSPGSGPANGDVLSYQWYKNSTNSNSGGQEISGATGATYTPSTDTLGTFYYYCVVTNTNRSIAGLQTAQTISSVAAITVDKGTPDYAVPTDLTAVYGDTLASVALPTGFTWENTGTVGNAGTQVHKATFTPVDTTNYNIVSGIDVNVTVNPKVITVTPDSGKWKYFGQSDPELSFSFSTIGYVAGETPFFTGRVARADGETVDSYAIEQNNLTLADNGAFLAGNYTLSFTSGVTFEIRSYQPTATAVLSATESYNGWSAGSITLTAPNGFEISSSQGGPWTASIPVNSDEGSDKMATYYLKNVGEGLEKDAISEVKMMTYKVDQTPPVITNITFEKINDGAFARFINFITFNAFFKEGFVTTIKAEDALSGVASISYSINGEDYTTISTDTDSISFTVNTDSKGTITAYASDKVGNDSAILESGGVINEANESEIAATNESDFSGWLNENNDLAIAVEDTDSGIYKITYSINDADTVTVFEVDDTVLSPLTTEQTFAISITAEGQYNAVITVEDNSGNIANKIIPIKMDKTAPTITLSGGDVQWVVVGRDFVTPNALVVDNLSDVSGDIIVNNTVDTSKIGIYIVSYTVADNAANSATAILTVNVIEADKDSLREYIDTVQQMFDDIKPENVGQGNEQYPQNVVDELQTAIADAETIYSAENSTEGEIAQAIEELQTAVGKFEDSKIKVDFSALDTAIAKAENMNKDNYTDDSWNALQTALTASKSIRAQTNLTQSEANSAADSILTAIDELKEKPPVPTPTPTPALTPTPTSTPTSTPIPTATPSSPVNNPQTGDRSNILTILAVMVVSFVAVLLLLIGKKRRKTTK